ncbi:MAG: MMPL family transporter [Thermodesulfobacteriota bacterium]|nr:MMPL family transporter [Thermodesulfobacteriota bacterium]
MEDDEHFKYYNRFKDEFGNDRFIYLVYDDPFTSHNVYLVNELGKELEKGLTENTGVGKDPYMKKLIMLPNVEIVEGKEGELFISALLKGWNGTQKELDIIKEKVLSKEVYRDVLVSKDGAKGALSVELNAIKDERNSDDIIYKIVSRIIEDEKYKRLNLRVVGGPILYARYNTICLSEVRRNIIIATIFVLFFLWYLFRNIVSVLCSLFTVELAIIWVAGLMPLFGINFTLMMTVLPPLFLVVGVGASVHVVTEFWRVFQSGLNRNDAIFESYKMVGFPCFLAAVTTAAGLGSMMVSRLSVIREFAMMAGIGIMLTFVTVLVFLPILLSFGESKKEEPFQHKGGYISTLLERISRFNERNSGLILFLTAGIIILCIWGVTKVHVDALWLNAFGDSLKIKQDYDYVDKTMGGTGSFDLVIDTRKEDGVKEPRVLNAVENIQRYAEDSNIVVKTLSVVDLIKEINRSIHDEDSKYFTIPDTRMGIAQLLLLYEGSGGGELNSTVDFNYQKIRLNIRIKTVKSSIWKEVGDELYTYAKNAMSGLANVNITGYSYLAAIINLYIIRTQIEGFLLAFCIITIMFIFVFRSIKQGLILMIPNLFPILLTLGIMGHANIELDYITLLITCVAIGIAVDDTIHFVTRYRLEFEILGDYKKALHCALNSTGRAMYITSIVLIFGFIVNIFSVMNSMIDFAILSSFTVLIALIADYFIAPAIIMKLRLFGPERLHTRH